MKTIFYFVLIGVWLFGLSAGINPEYIRELFWGILLPWLVVLVELFFIYKAKEKKSELTTKVLLVVFVSKMFLFAIYLSLIIYFYFFRRIFLYYLAPLRSLTCARSLLAWMLIPWWIYWPFRARSTRVCCLGRRIRRMVLSTWWCPRGVPKYGVPMTRHAP